LLLPDYLFYLLIFCLKCVAFLDKRIIIILRGVLTT